MLFSSRCLAQANDISGKVIGNEDVDAIHVLNKTALKFTISNTDGSFRIPVRVGDTLTFSSLRYELKEVLINQRIIERGFVEVRLKEKVNELDEIVIGKILTGSLSSDITNSSEKTDLNFYDLGIPGYTGKPKTQQERRLNEATTGGGFVPLNPILNWISGRTKRLKNNIEVERNAQCLQRFRDDFEETLFEKQPLEEDLRVEYFYFCSESEGFSELCRKDDPISMIDFFQEKLEIFKENAALREEVKKTRELESTKKN
jgi:hypothetical protein